MTNLEREHFATFAHEATTLEKIWLREREEKRTVLAAANAEIKRRWVELDNASTPIPEPSSLKNDQLNCSSTASVAK